MKPPIIKTPRLLLQVINDQDAEAMLQYRSNPVIIKYQNWKPKTLDEVRGFIVQNSRDFNIEGTWFQLGIYEKKMMALIGDIGLHFLEPANAQVEIGITVAKAHQSNGYGREGVKGTIDYLFKVMKKHRVIASIDPDNSFSIALFEGIGMCKEGHFHKSILEDNVWKDDLIYAVLAENWL